MMPVKYALKTLVKNICTKNYFVKRKTDAFHKFMQNRLMLNESPTIFSCNCAGGLIYHNLGLKFNSPTVNLTIENKYFIKFIKNPEYYLSLELTEGEYRKDQAYPAGGYPTGILGDIKIYFNHYKTFNEAKEKWNDRKERVNLDNLYIIMSSDQLTYDQLCELKEIKCKRLVVFTNHKYSELDYCFLLKSTVEKPVVGSFANIKLDGFRIYEKEFDYVAWLNMEEDYRTHYFENRSI